MINPFVSAIIKEKGVKAVDHREFVRHGRGSDKAVLLIHGILGTPRHFDRFLDVIPQEWSVYNILLDGHGGTVCDFAKTSMEKWKQQVGDTLQTICGKYSQVVIIAHSMGTLLSIEAAPRHPAVKAMVLLNVPLVVRLTPAMAVRSIKVAMDKINEQDPLETATRDATSIETDKRLWRYVSWLPRFLELLKLCRQTVDRIPQIGTECYVFQSRKDELVSARSCRYLENEPKIRYAMLEDSCHFYYSGEDLDRIRACVGDVLEK